MAINILLIVNRPTDNETILGPTLTVSGNASGLTRATEPIDVPIDSVTISVTGQSPITKNNTRHHINFNWSASFNITSPGQLRIGVKANYGSETSPEVVRNVNIVLDEDPPDITITGPSEGQDIGGAGPLYTVPIAGTAEDASVITSVQYEVDDDGRFRNVIGGPGNNWIWHQSIEGLTLGPHTIKVTAIDEYNNTSVVSRAITCIDTGPPEINIISPETSPHKITWAEGGVSVDIAGTSNDPTTPVQLVEWRLNNGDWNNATDTSLGSWLNWRFTATMSAPGQHDIEVRATDGAGNPNTDSIVIDVAVPFELQDLGFAAYLEDLMIFTRRRVRKISDSAAIEKTLLESYFHQPYTRLTNDDYTIVATRPVAQVRIAIEVLRSYLSNNDQFDEYYEAAYRLLLANFGTSFAEIRLVRAADTETRQALADRLGIDVTGLDNLFIPPDQLTEQKLQAVFGLIDSTLDPLTLAIDQSELLTMQLSTLRIKWLHQDELNIINEDVPLPAIDPDTISESDIKNRISGNVAYDVFISRQQWIIDQRNLIQLARESAGTPLAGFNDAVNLVLGSIDLPALERSYTDGVDIEPTLHAMQLELAAFFVLARIQQLADTGLVLDSEWKELYEILVQVKKLREFPAWAQAELNTNLSLEPTFFVLNATRPDLIVWRSTWRARRNWEKKLKARFKQREALKQAHQAAIDATEGIVLPRLRDLLIGTIDRQGYPDLDIADWLTQRLSISFKYSGEQKLTRLEQGVETLQGILLSLRTGRINALTRLPVGTDVPQWELAVNEDYNEYDFDKEWEWMGSYATWRGAMFAFGYPENYLLPTLRDKEEWTSAFIDLVKKTRQAWRLTPNQAEGLAADYLALLNTSVDANGDPITYDIDLTSQLSKEQLRARRVRSKTELIQYIDPVRGGLKSNTPPHLKEVFFFVPMFLALSLLKKGQFRAALDWFQTVYAYELPPAERKIYFGLEAEEALPTEFRRTFSWLLEGLDVFDIANDRANALTRFTLISIVRCYLAYADAEFTRESNASIPFARRLYITSLDLLDLLNVPPPVAHWSFDEDEGAIASDITGNGHTAVLSGGQWEVNGWHGGAISFNGNNEYATVQHAPALALGKDGADFSVSFVMNLRENATGNWRTVIRKGAATIGTQRTPGILLWPDKNFIDFRISTTADPNEGGESKSEIALNTWTHIAYVKQGRSLKLYIKGQLDKEIILTGDSVGFDEPLFIGDDTNTNGSNALFDDVQVFDRVLSADAVIALSGIDVFPPNPVIDALQQHAELSLRKLRNGRNIAGMERIRTKPVAAELVIVDGALVPPPSTNLRPTAYRYLALVDRAKQLVSISQQIEANFFSALERRDAEAYSLINAQHDVNITKETVELQDLRIQEADSQIDLLGLHQDRTQIQFNTYNEWINAGANQYERAMLENYKDIKNRRNIKAGLDAVITIGNAISSALLAEWSKQAAAAAISAGTSAAALAKNINEAFINTLEFEAQKNEFNGNLERRKDEWRLQSALAQQDIEIAAHQIFQAKLSKQLVEQERAIASIQAEHAEAVVEFLNNKFTNVDLYEWMSDILSGVYSYFLQQATAMAQLALNQLAFERQERPPAFIQGDYWQVPNEAGPQTEGEEEPDRRGITGSARLLQDIYQLDQYAFESKKRNLQLVEHFSLARLVPYEFQRFRETGVLPFATPMSLFDKGFPGHYLRLIKRVRVSIVGLIPPTQGVRASLSSAGVSRVITGREVYRVTEVRRPSEMIAFTSTSNATGLFELQQENELLLPFETMGVDANWELQLPKAANRFDYDALADVIFTVEYTALNSSDYRQQVIQEVDRSYSSEQAYSIKHSYPDLWYDLNQPDVLIDDISGDVHAQFVIEQSHFPPNLEFIGIGHIVLYFVRSDNSTFEVNVADLRFEQYPSGNETSYGGATSMDGVISTRRANASSWMPLIGKPPAGKWTLVFTNTEQFLSKIKDEEITDILFVVSYSGDTPPWPS